MKLAVLDLYNGDSNVAIDSIRRLAGEAGIKEISVFDVCQKNELPALEDWDLFVSSGGPGNPSDDEDWKRLWAEWMRQLVHFNRTAERPKPAFLICYSFQLFCLYFGVGESSRRAASSFGPVWERRWEDGSWDPLFSLLDDRFQAVDSRSFQILPIRELPDEVVVLAVEARPLEGHPPALTAFRYGTALYATQFHPEVNARILRKESLENKEELIQRLGAEGYEKVLAELDDMEDLEQTHRILLPGFFKLSFRGR